MALFQSSVLKKYLAAQASQPIQEALAAYLTYFHNPRIKENIRAAKEEQFQEGFLRELFVKILGYTINPEPDFNLTTELKNIKDSKKTDGAILKDGNALAVIELKGTDTKDLDKIRDQAFNYKNNQPDCVYVITSNFEKLRVYIDNAVDYVEFNILAMDNEQFKLLWLLLQKDNLLQGLPKKIKEESLLAEEQITKQLYKDYSAFKQELWQDLVAQNPEQDELLLYKKSQKLLDRFLFIFFAEDKGLLPPNSILEIVNQWKKLAELDEYRPIYERFKKYFGYLNTGRVQPGKAEIHAYNGGLFAIDPVLEELKISDSVLEKHVRKLTEYDFDTEVDTNILGHIFEHSLNDIENVRAQLAGETVEKSKTKRKRDGVFYTPKYITKYIVDNTLGRLCTEKKAELEIIDEDFAEGKRGRQKKTIQKLKDKLDTYRTWLLQLTICDPACGSGAFLNQVLEFLIAEHRYVDELEAQLFDSPLVLPNVENHILENNIFGVDINEESVEIARLSLWLRTAKKGRKLSSLNSNIKVGNSLIDDPEVAGDLAFDWQAQFPQVFAKGGFDVVVGNPPYVRQELVKHFSKYLESNYSSFSGKADLFTYFFEKGLNILRQNGLLSFISSGKFFEASYGKPLVDHIFLNYKVFEVIDFYDLEVFEGISAYPLILTIENTKPENDYLFNYCFVPDLKISALNEIMTELEFEKISKDVFIKNDNNFYSIEVAKIFEKCSNDSLYLKDLRLNPLVGIKTGFNEGYITSEENNEYSKGYIFGRNIKRYRKPIPEERIIFPYKKDGSEYVFVEIDDLTDLKNHLLENRKKLESRAIICDGIKNNSKVWYEYQQINRALDFEKQYIVYPNVSLGCNFTLSSSNIIDMTGFIIPSNDLFILGVLNSNLVKFLMNNLAISRRGGYQEFKTQYLEKIPFKKVSGEYEQKFKGLVQFELEWNQNLQKVENSLIHLILSKFSIEKPSTKLQNWPDLDFKGFLGELSKAKVKLSLAEEAEWMAYFNEQKAKALALQADITRLDREIDALVYELYGLTEEEIKIVEGE